MMAQDADISNFHQLDDFEFFHNYNLFQLASNTNDYQTNSTEINQPSDFIGLNSNTKVVYDYNTTESFVEMDIGDINMAEMYTDDLFKKIVEDLTSIRSDSADDITTFLKAVTGEEPEVDKSIYLPTQSDDMQHIIQSTDDHLAIYKSTDSSLPITQPYSRKPPKSTGADPGILLSRSVAVTMTAPNQLSLATPLEETYRPRYKSDYFPMKGTIRRPRYVADIHGQHYITLKMPKVYPGGFQNKYIRVALLTIDLPNEGHLYSPYKFQRSNTDPNVSDQNPIYTPVKINESDGNQIKLQLVLIKSKLDQLSASQPLEPFDDNRRSKAKDTKLSPKELINKYQLEKSQLAFTLCTLLPDGTYDIHRETTVYSSVITEASVKHSTPSSQSTDNQTHVQQQIRCPHCSACFQLSTVDQKKQTLKKQRKEKASKIVLKVTNTKNNKRKKKCPE